MGEKDQVLEQIRAGTADIQMAARYLTPEQIRPFQEGFRYLQDAAELQKQWTRAFFAQRMWMNKPTADTEMVVRDALAKLEALDQSPTASWGRNPQTAHRYNIDRFVLEMRWRLANRSRALAEDARLLDDTKRLMDVAVN